MEQHDLNDFKPACGKSKGILRSTSPQWPLPRSAFQSVAAVPQGFAIDLGFVEIDPRVLGDLVVPLLV